MTTKKAIGALAMAALLVLAGCSSAVPGSNTQVQTTEADGGDGATTDGSTSADLTFYVSDRPGAIEDFEHLNVTITKIGLHKTSGDDGADDGDETESANDTTADDANADAVQTTTVEDPNETTVTMTTTESTETETETEDSEATETETEDSDETETEESDETETEESDETETEESEESDDSEGDDAENEGWVMKDVDNETVDLTKLKGANATAIGNLSVSAGEYDKVFVYVSDINATLENGESVNVKLPSEKLQINKAFTISENSSPDFVFDINVHKAGGSGKYILRPIVSESGTGDQVEIEKVDKNGKPENPGANGKDKGDDDDETESEVEDDDSDSERTLEATIQGAVRAGEDVTLAVTDGDGAVANATVTVNGEAVGETNADGTLTFEVPDDDELEVTVESDDAEVELERKIKGGGNGKSLEPYALV